MWQVFTRDVADVWMRSLVTPGRCGNQLRLAARLVRSEIGNELWRVEICLLSRRWGKIVAQHESPLIYSEGDEHGQARNY